MTTRWLRAAARRFRVPDRRLRALGGPRGGRAAGRGRRRRRRCARFVASALWQAGAWRAAVRRAPRIDGAGALAELDALVRRVPDQPRRQPRQPDAGPRAAGDARARVFPDERSRARAAIARGRSARPPRARCSAPSLRALGVPLERRRSALFCTSRCAACSRRRCASGSLGPHEAQRLQPSCAPTLERGRSTRCATLDARRRSRRPRRSSISAGATHDRLYSRLFQS